MSHILCNSPLSLVNGHWPDEINLCKLPSHATPSICNQFNPCGQQLVRIQTKSAAMLKQMGMEINETRKQIGTFTIDYFPGHLTADVAAAHKAHHFVVQAADWEVKVSRLQTPFCSFSRVPAE